MEPLFNEKGECLVCAFRVRKAREEIQYHLDEIQKCRDTIMKYHKCRCKRDK